jgi:hypothetical protein
MNLTLRSKQHQGLVLFRQGKVVQKLEKTRSQINSIQSFQAIPKKTQQNAPNCSVDGSCIPLYVVRGILMQVTEPLIDKGQAGFP